MDTTWPRMLIVPVAMASSAFFVYVAANRALVMLKEIKEIVHEVKDIAHDIKSTMSVAGEVAQGRNRNYLYFVFCNILIYDKINWVVI